MSPINLDQIARQAFERQGWEPTIVPALIEEYRILLGWFREEVNRRAENKMLLTGKLEGSHFAAMTELFSELKVPRKSDAAKQQSSAQGEQTGRE